MSSSAALATTDLSEVSYRAGLADLWIADQSVRDNTGVVRQAGLPIALKDFTLLAQCALALFDAGWPVGMKVGYMHLDADRLSPAGDRQQTLFARMRDPKASAIADVMRAIHERMGRFAVRPGATLSLRLRWSARD